MTRYTAFVPESWKEKIMKTQNETTVKSLVNIDAELERLHITIRTAPNEDDRRNAMVLLQEMHKLFAKRLLITDPLLNDLKLEDIKWK